MAATFDELAPGHKFPPQSYRINADDVSAYNEAVGATPRDHVPPLLIAAHAIASLADLIAFKEGVIHAAQEFSFSRTVPMGAEVTCAVSVLRKLSRGPVRMLTLEMNISDESGAPVQTGRSTIVLLEA